MWTFLSRFSPVIFRDLAEDSMAGTQNGKLCSYLVRVSHAVVYAIQMLWLYANGGTWTVKFARVTHDLYSRMSPYVQQLKHVYEPTPLIYYIGVWGDNEIYNLLTYLYNYIIRSGYKATFHVLLHHLEETQPAQIKSLATAVCGVLC